MIKRFARAADWARLGFVWGMEKMKAFWRWVKKNSFWFLAGIVAVFWMFWVKGAVDFAVMFNDWVKCKMMALPCLNSRWEVIKFIICGITIGVILLFVAVMLGRRIARIENSGMKKVKIFWKEYVVSSWQIVRKVLVVGFLFFVGALGLLLFALLIAVLFDACIECWAKIVLGISEDMTKQDVIKFIGWGITGILAFFGAVAINSRADAQVQIAKAEVENNKLIEKGHVQERFKTAVKNLESEHKTVRITPFYDFYHLARDNNDMRQNIFDILCAHLQQIVSDDEYKEKIGFIDEGDNSEVRPTEEVQNLLDILFQSRDSEGELIFVEFGPKLQKIFLVGANLQGAKLPGVNMERVNLLGVNLSRADLRGAWLGRANLHGARLYKTNLQDAVLQRTILTKADLWEANLQRADLLFADLQDANLREADLQDAYLLEVNLQSATLRRAKLQGVMLKDSNLKYANLWSANLQKANLQTTNLYLAILSSADLQRADLQGADLRHADLRYADLRRANLRHANLQYAHLDATDLRNADLREADLRYTDFWNTKNLETAKLSGAKVKGAKPSKGFQWPEDVDTTTDAETTSDD